MSLLALFNRAHVKSHDLADRQAGIAHDGSRREEAGVAKQYGELAFGSQPGLDAADGERGENEEYQRPKQQRADLDLLAEIFHRL